MKIEDLLRRNLRLLRLPIPVTATVSALDCFDWGQPSFGYLPPLVLGTGYTGGGNIEAGDASRGMCRYYDRAHSLSHPGTSRKESTQGDFDPGCK